MACQPQWRLISDFVESLMYCTSVPAFQSQRKTRNHADFLIMNLSVGLLPSLNKLTSSRHLFLRSCYKGCPFLCYLEFKISHYSELFKNSKDFSIGSISIIPLWLTDMLDSICLIFCRPKLPKEDMIFCLMFYIRFSC